MNFLKETFSQFSKDRCTTLAAALAYYTIFALPPLLYLLLTVLTFGLTVFSDRESAEQRAQKVIERQAAQMLGNEAATEEISTILEKNDQTGGKWWKTLISFVGIAVGATGVVAALQDALNRVWEVAPDPESSGIMNQLTKRLLSFGMILGLGFLLLVSLVISTVLTSLGEQVGGWIGMDQGVAQAVNYVVQFLVVMVIFATIFKYMPDAVIRWRDVLVGALITTILFLVGRLALQLYLSLSEPGAQLGSAAASLAVILVWVYYSAMIVLYGAEVTQVYARRFGKGIRPEPGSVRIVETTKRSDEKRADN